MPFPFVHFVKLAAVRRQTDARRIRGDGELNCPPQIVFVNLLVRGEGGGDYGNNAVDSGLVHADDPGLFLKSARGTASRAPTGGRPFHSGSCASPAFRRSSGTGPDSPPCPPRVRATSTRSTA